jgi:hypothetical protein
MLRYVSVRVPVGHHFVQSAGSRGLDQSVNLRRFSYVIKMLSRTACKVHDAKESRFVSGRGGRESSLLSQRNDPIGSAHMHFWDDGPDQYSIFVVSVSTE